MTYLDVKDAGFSCFNELDTWSFGNGIPIRISTDILENVFPIQRSLMVFRSHIIPYSDGVANSSTYEQQASLPRDLISNSSISS